MSTAHTATPWHVVLSDNATPHIHHEHGGDWTDINDLDSRICVMPVEITHTFNSYKNAEFIVRACNSHDDLVKALQAVAATLHSHDPLKTTVLDALVKASAA